MATPIRSLIEPPGFCDSSFRNSRQGPVSKRVTSTSGVLPIRSSTAGRLLASIGEFYVAFRPGAVRYEMEDVAAIRTDVPELRTSEVEHGVQTAMNADERRHPADGKQRAV